MPPLLTLDPEVFADVEQVLQREWLETNGLGGFSSSTVTGANTRRYHGLLTAATKAPVGRMVLLSRFEEALVVGEQRLEFSTNRYPGTLHPRGYRYLTGFRLDPWPVFDYNVEGIEFEKHVFMVHGENTTVVQYVFRDAPSCRLELRPLLAYRDYHTLMHANGSIYGGYVETEDAVVFMPYDGTPLLHVSHGGRAAVSSTGDWYYRFMYDREQERGLDFEEDLFNPCHLSFNVQGPTTISVVASTEERSATQADAMRESEERRRLAVTERVPDADPFLRRLLTAADTFIVARGEGKTVIAGYHWFSDWGRDTMIALPGLTLSTGRIDDARAILSEFVRHLDRGMLPNRFPDAGEQPEYNTVDATLWLFEAVRRLVEVTGDVPWAIQEMYPALNSAIEWHVAGTRFGIKAEADGLLRAGAAGTQLTWMDVKIGDWAVTPRQGKAVEIQALWYNALRITQHLASEAHDVVMERTVGELADLAQRNFARQFWNETDGCLYDVVDGERRDGSIRPNQMFAVSVHYGMLTPEQERLVVDVVERHLVTPAGLRTLSPVHRQYRPRYEGAVFSRDSAYHQGTVWPWLMGPFLTGYLKINRNSDEAMEQVTRWLHGFDRAMMNFGLGQLPEVADGDAPHRPGGCIAQAWSVAEILRVACEIRSWRTGSSPS